MRAAELAIPFGIAALMVYALFKNVNVYKAFIEGAKEALPELLGILPPLCAMMTGIEVMRASGLMEALCRALSPVTGALGMESELMPLIILRPFSGSAALGLLRETLETCGPDSPVGMAASIIVGSTETVFYTIAVYFGAVGVTKTRHAIPAALIAGAVGTAAGLLLAKLPWGG